jgi:hypothetical protein
MSNSRTARLTARPIACSARARSFRSDSSPPTDAKAAFLASAAAAEAAAEEVEEKEAEEEAEEEEDEAEEEETEEEEEKEEEESGANVMQLQLRHSAPPARCA